MTDSPGTTAGDASARMVPFQCPYCGDEDLRPTEGGTKESGAAWECRSCARAFALKFLGLTSRGVNPS